MSENITKELRKLADMADDWGLRVSTCELREIADHIDAAHEDEVARWIEQAHAEDIADMSNDDLAEHGLVRLPVDADGKPWHIGDLAECESERFKVCEVIRGIDGVYIRGTGQRFGYKASDSRHYKPTPAERLRTIADRLANGEDAQGFVSELADIAAEVDG